MADVQIIKLSSGEDIIGTVTELTLEGGKYEFVLGLTPYCPYAKDLTIPIMPMHVISVYHPSTDLLNEYNRRFGSGLVVPDDKIKSAPKQIITG
jgi:hypothetical protein